MGEITSKFEWKWRKLLAMRSTVVESKNKVPMVKITIYQTVTRRIWEWTKYLKK